MEITPDLLKRCREKNRKAQYELYRECFPVLMSISSRYHQNEIDSRAMVNEGFLKIITNLEKFSAEMPFKLWIRRIMINTIIDNFRKEKHYSEQVRHMELAHLQLIGHHDLSLKDSYDAEDLLSMIRKLPPMTSRVFNMFAIDGYSHVEIAGLLGISDGTSKWHVADARKKLSGMLKAENQPSVKIHNR